MPIDPNLHALLSREAQILLLAAGDESNDAAIRLMLKQPIDWSRLAWLAEWERATSVLWRRLQRVAPAAVPNDVTESFQRLTMIGDFRALYLQERCDAILDALQAQGVEVVLLKGAALVHSAYGSFVDRPMGDVDLLVPEERMDDAWRIATATGWQWNSALFPASKYAEHHHRPPLFDNRRTGAKLELHSRLRVEGHPFSLGFVEARANAIRLAPPREHVMILDANHQVVNLCVHFAWSHLMLFGGWRAFRDLAALTATGKVDWDRVTDLSRRHKAASSCYWTFRLARHLSGVAIPAGALEALVSGGSTARPGMVERHLTSQLFPTERLCPSEQIHRLFWRKALQPERVGAARPWDAEDVELQDIRPVRRVGRRVAHQLENLVNWWRYLRMVGVANR